MTSQAALPLGTLSRTEVTVQAGRVHLLAVDHHTGAMLFRQEMEAAEADVLAVQLHNAVTQLVAQGSRGAAP